MQKKHLMYRKRLDNFRSHHSDNSKRSNKQKSRFQRACRSVFYNRGNNKKSQRRVDSLEEKLQRARQHRFLFLPSQHINRPIQHVNYHNPFRRPAPRYPRDDSISTTSTSSPATNSQPVPVEDENIWHDKLGIWIPNSLLPYVTSILTGGGPFDQKKNTGLCLDCLYFGYLGCDVVLGTPPDSLKVPEWRCPRALAQELGRFNIDYFSVMNDDESHYRYKGHTSDEAKQLEIRPHKRPPVLSTNADRRITDIKKLKPDTTSPEDSKVFASV
ncbi:hypothetical protein RhiirA5_383659 [Rhizophagus irregularis]|uniref:DUF8211 domain-containing protein n=1 Tax=Rhizophagus irregularis TaxID=588596 RepID=A0A2N0NW62_9GLOM|nr:hypothetical protein RhiirA5_383659 [Rhizophagus irregularis]